MLMTHPWVSLVSAAVNFCTCSTCRLESLQLRFCGRPFGPEAAAALTSGGALSGLTSMELGGAYRLTDAPLLDILRAAPVLTELRLPQCPRITGAAIEQLPTLVPNLRLKLDPLD